MTINRDLAALYLESLSEVTSLSRLEQAYLLLLLQRAKMNDPLCGQIATELRGNNWRWLEMASLFEVSVILSALYAYDETLLDGTCLAYIATILPVYEQTIGGPYHPPKGQSMPDTNAAIAVLFRLFKAPLANVETYIRQVHCLSPFSALLLMYASLPIAKENVEQPRTLYETYAYMAAFNMPSPEKQRRNGSWHNDPLCTALALYVCARPRNIKKALSKHTVFHSVRVELSMWPEPLRSKAVHVLDTIVRSQSSMEIATIIPLFLEALKPSCASIPQETQDSLQLATVFFWMALTAFDDVMDDGATRYVPAGMSMYRRVIELYETLLPAGMREYFTQIDVANEWELQYCHAVTQDEAIIFTKLPRFAQCKVLAQRAYGHVMGPLAILEILHVPEKQKKYVRSGFEHYLIARQLSDDLHDWESDLRRGQISYVIALLLRHLRIGAGTYRLAGLEGRMHLAFFRVVLRRVSEKMLWHCEQSRVAFVESGLFHEHASLFELIDKKASIARQGIRANDEHMAFAKYYDNRDTIT